MRSISIWTRWFVSSTKRRLSLDYTPSAARVSSSEGFTV